jgi:hypothetical protein
LTVPQMDRRRGFCRGGAGDRDGRVGRLFCYRRGDRGKGALGFGTGTYVLVVRLVD